MLKCEIHEQHRLIIDGIIYYTITYASHLTGTFMTLQLIGACTGLLISVKDLSYIRKAMIYLQLICDSFICVDL